MNLAEVKNPTLANIAALESRLLAMPPADIVTIHGFLPGLYKRTIIIPAWTVLTGAAHKTNYRVCLEEGEILVNTDEGVRHLVAPYEFYAPAGVKRVGRVLGARVVWTDIYANPDNCRDIPVLEGMLYEVPDCGLGETMRQKRIGADRSDYDLFVRQIGLTHDQMRSIVTNSSDLIDMPSGFDVSVKESSIHGLGMFALRAFRKNEAICPGRIGGKRTPAGRYLNHSLTPNVATVKFYDDIFAVAISDIHEGQELTVNYRDSMYVNFGIEVGG